VKGEKEKSVKNWIEVADMVVDEDMAETLNWNKIPKKRSYVDKDRRNNAENPVIEKIHVFSEEREKEKRARRPIKRFPITVSPLSPYISVCAL